MNHLGNLLIRFLYRQTLVFQFGKMNRWIRCSYSGIVIRHVTGFWNNRWSHRYIWLFHFATAKLQLIFDICKYLHHLLYFSAKYLQRGAAWRAWMISPSRSISSTCSGSITSTWMSSVASRCCSRTFSTPVARKV